MVRDVHDEQLEYLKVIANQLGAATNELGEISHDTPAGSGPTAIGQMPPSGLVINETADLDDANEDGSVTLEPGEREVICEMEARVGDALLLLAIGATDREDVQYLVRIDHDKIAGGARNSPLGTVNSPFSFIDTYNSALRAETSIEYLAQYDPAASGTVDLAARMHVQRI